MLRWASPLALARLASRDFCPQAILMLEPDVVLTDYLLAALSLVFAALMWRATGPLRLPLATYFASAAVASAAGGTVHGFFADPDSLGAAVLWRIALLAIGVATLANWTIGARLLFAPRVARWIVLAAGLQLAAYSVVVLFVSQDFRVAILDNLPALLFLLVALVLAYGRHRRAGLLVAAGGLVLTLVAAALQQLQIGIHPVYFNYNAVFHTVQALALLVFFLGARGFVDLGGWGLAQPQAAAREEAPRVSV
jgi:hypothetical protein